MDAEKGFFAKAGVLPSGPSAIKSVPNLSLDRFFKLVCQIDTSVIKFKGMETWRLMFMDWIGL